MRSTLPNIARELGADERTFRRAASRGAVRCRRPGPRQLDLDAGELAYLHDHWDLLSTLTRALRTEPNVGLAVLHGSMARGDDRPGSDVDLLVRFRSDAPGAASELAMRLERVIGRDVDVARLDPARDDAPLLVLQALDEGRVLVDRDGLWPKLRLQRSGLSRAARRRLEADRRQAAEALDRLLAEDV